MPRPVLPSKKVTVPVAFAAGAVDMATVVVRVTACPTPDGFADDARVTLRVALLTTWLTWLDVLAANTLSPEYTAVIGCEPTESTESDRVALPFGCMDAVPNRVPLVPPS